MGLMDRLRPSQPRWRHPEAAVRLEAVREMTVDAGDALTVLATSDEDARVRKAAVARLDHMDTLGRVASADVDSSVREEAAARLAAIAADATDETIGRAAVAALGGGADARIYLTLAKGASLDAVGRAAVDALLDSKALSAVARQSRHEIVARAALDRLDDAAELAQVALRSEHRDVALAALDRVTDREAIEHIASRAKHKAVVRRARALLRPPVESDSPVNQFGAALGPEPVDEASETPVATLHDDQQPPFADVQTPSLVPGGEPVVESPTLAGALPAGDPLAGSAAVIAPAEVPESAEANESVHAPEVAEAPEPVPAPETVSAPETAASSLPVAGNETVDVPPPAEMPVPVAVPDTPEQRAEKLSHLIQLLDGAEQVLSATDFPDARTRWNALRRDWTAILLDLAIDEETAGRIRRIEAQIDERESALREARTKQQHENLLRLQHLSEQLEKVAQSERLTLRDAERALREARAALDAPGPLPSRQDQQMMVARLKSVQSMLFPRVQDLREADEWERWANAGVQESLIRRLEGLREEADPANVARQLRQIHDEWHKVRSVPREKGRDLWQRYKTVEAEIRERCESFFQHVASERGDNLKAKEALCEQVEALTESTDWIRTAETIKGLQAQWKTIGPVTPGHEKAIWERFRAACDHFFTRRKQDLTERKTVWTVNLQKKEQICAALEALADTTDWDHALAEVKRLQADWRTVGPVKRSRAESLLLRFRNASERFFDSYAHRNDQEVARQAAAREQACQSLEALLPAGDDPATVPEEGILKHVLALKRQWDSAPTLPRAEGEPLAARFAQAMNRLSELHADAFKGSELDPETTRQRLEHLCELVEGLAGEDRSSEQLSPAAILATQWREALAANTIGGRADDEAKWRNAAEEIRKAQAAWRRIGPLSDATSRELNDRFQRACNRFFRQRERRNPSTPQGR